MTIGAGANAPFNLTRSQFPTSGSCSISLNALTGVITLGKAGTYQVSFSVQTDATTVAPSQLLLQLSDGQQVQTVLSVAGGTLTNTAMFTVASSGVKLQLANNGTNPVVVSATSSNNIAINQIASRC